MVLRRTAVAICAVLAAVGIASSVSLADDADPPDAPPLAAPDGPFLGVLGKPPEAIAEDDSPPDAAASRLLLSYRGGAVMHSSTVYAVYWLPPGSSVSQKYISLINGYLADVARDSKKHTNVYGAVAQYYDQTASGTKRPIAYSVAVGASYTDTAAFPAGGCADTAPAVCLTDSQLKAELARVIRAKRWPSGYSNAYFLFLPRNIDICMAPGACTYSGSSGFCAYHSYFGAGPTLYAAIPYASRLGCSAGQRPHFDDADDTLNGLSHEHNEMITDPDQRGWLDAAGYENGDKCAWTFGSSLGGATGGHYNQVINGDHYFLQEEWSNDGARCLQRY